MFCCATSEKPTIEQEAVFSDEFQIARRVNAFSKMFMKKKKNGG